QAASSRFVADETQHLEVPFALRLRNTGCLHAIAGDSYQKWIREMEIGVADAGREIVTQPKGQVETVEPFGSQHGQITSPESSVIKPDFIFHVAREHAQVGTDLIRGLFNDGLAN